MLQKHSDRKNIEGNKKPKERIEEILGAIVVFSVLTYKTVFHRQDYDTVFDAGGKAAVIVILIVFFVIYYIQIKKGEKEE